MKKGDEKYSGDQVVPRRGEENASLTQWLGGKA
jgi:hypothetical protein